MQSCESLVLALLPHFSTLYFCLHKEFPFYCDWSPVLTDPTRCTGTAVLLLRILAGSQAYDLKLALSSLTITSLASKKDNWSLHHLDQLDRDLFQNNTPGLFLIRLVKHYKHILKEPELDFDSHTFLLEKTSHRKCKFLIYQSYIHKYTLQHYLQTYHNCYHTQDMHDFLDDLRYLFSKTNWNKTCANLWKKHFHVELSDKLIGQPFKDHLYFAYAFVPIDRDTAKKRCTEFVREQLLALKGSDPDEWYDLPCSAKNGKMITNGEMATCLQDLKKL